MKCYCTCILEISMTTLKMGKFQTLKLSQFHKAKTYLTENWWSIGIMITFEGSFSMFWGAKKIFKKILKIF